MNKFKFLLFLLAAVAAVTFSACKGRSLKEIPDQSGTVGSFTKTGSVERLSPKLDDIIPRDELPEIIAEGFEWTEGPLWLPQQDILLFSDIPRNSVFQWSEKDGLKVYLEPSGFTGYSPRGGEAGSNGLLLDPQGRLVLCQHGDRRIARMNAEIDTPVADYVTLADKWQGKRFNSPNDAVFSSKGDLFFTDPAYGLEKGFEDPAREISFTGVFRLTAGGDVTLLNDKMSAPNGIALSPDETMLYVANSGEGDKALWMEYQLNVDGTLDEGKIFHDTSKKNEGDTGAPDGMKIRKDGIMFATGPGGVWIFSPDGEHLGTIKTGQATSNCALDDDGRYLYITADMYVMRIKLQN